MIHAALTPVLISRPCVHYQAERLQQYRDKVAQQSAAIPAAASLHAQSNLEQLVDHMSQDEHTQHDTQARLSSCLQELQHAVFCKPFSLTVAVSYPAQAAGQHMYSNTCILLACHKACCATLFRISLSPLLAPPWRRVAYVLSKRQKQVR